MYRLPSALSIAFVLSFNTFGVAQETKLEFTFLEDMPPATQKLESSEIKPVDFDQLFAAQPDVKSSDDKSSPAKPAPVSKTAKAPSALPPVAVAPLPAAPAVGPAPVARVPVPVIKATPEPAPTPIVALAARPVTKPESQPVSAAAAESESVPAVGGGVQATAAIEEIGGGIVMEGEMIDGDAAMPQPLAVDCACGMQVTHCETCNNHTTCNCRSKGHRCSRLTNWWHNTKLYHSHIRNLGQPGMFCERPFGVCNQGFAESMILAGKADRAVLHHYDFAHYADGAVELTPQGRRELHRIVNMMGQYPVPLVVESTQNVHVDASRRLAVISAATQLGLPISPESIHVADDPSIGLSGIEAQLLQNIRASEMATGASRTQPFVDSSRATYIPFLSGEKTQR